MGSKYIACYGDSLVQGFPYGTQYSWTAVVEKAVPVKMLNYGICGECCDDILFRLRQYALPEYVRHVLFLGGANDVLQGRPLSAIVDDMSKACAWCEEKQYRLCLVLPFISADAWLNKQLEPVRQELQQKFQDKALLLDVQPAIGLTPEERRKAYLDGVHPKAETYAAIGAYAAPLLWAWLQEDNC